MKTGAEKQFAEVLKELMAARKMSFRTLAKLTRGADPGGKGLSPTYLNGIARGEQRPALGAMVLIARALGIAPTRFAEYRLAQVRREFDERQVGLADALQHLDELLRLLPAKGSDLATRLKTAASSE